jgi:hypothetical protein
MLQEWSAAPVADLQLVNLLGERPTAAPRAVAEQPPHRQPDRHWAAADGEVRQRTDIATVHPCRDSCATQAANQQLAGTDGVQTTPFSTSHPFHLHRIKVQGHDPYKVITSADGAATSDGASLAHGGIRPRHENLAGTTFTILASRP